MENGSIEPSEICPRHQRPVIAQAPIMVLGRTLRRPRLCSKCEEEERQKALDETARSRQYAQILLRRDSGIPERYQAATLEQLRRTSAKEIEAANSITRFAEGLGKSITALVIIGGVGTGKTFMGSALVHYWIQHDRSAVYTTAIQALRKIKSSWSSESPNAEAKAIRSLTAPELLVIDEVGVQFNSHTETVFLTEIINGRYNSFKPTVVISNLTLKELTGVMVDRAVDRLLERGKVVPCAWPSYRRQSAGLSS